MVTETLRTEAIESLDSVLHGNLVRPGDPRYDDARSVWNGMIDKHPRLIARCRGTADVLEAVSFARRHDLPVAVRGGGHNVAGTAVCDDGIVIDLSEMRGVWVDPDERTAWVQGGAKWGDVDHETQAFGLATPGGVVSDTGVAGLTLGGGLGHLRCQFGLSCDNLRSVDVVTADGEYLTASPEQHKELFWGIQGGGGNFGIATGFEFELHPLGPKVATNLVFYQAEDMAECLRDYRGYVESAPDEVSTITSAGVLPDDELFPADVVHEEKIAVLGCYAGSPEEGAEVLAPLGSLADPIADFSGTMPYTDFQQLFDEDYPDGMRYYWKSLYLEGLSNRAIDRIVDWATRAPSPLSTVDIWELRGAISEVDKEASAFAGRSAPYLLALEANWEDPAKDEANISWVRECLDDLQAHSDGSVYLNFPGFLEDNDETMERTFGETYERLVALKNEYDPTNLFSRNQNVKPSI